MKTVDENGIEVVIEEITDENGNKKQIKRKILQDGTLEEEIFDPLTGEKKIVRKKRDD